MGIVLVLAFISKCDVSLQKSQYITVSMIFVGCTPEKLIPHSAMREKEAGRFRVILLESPGDLADSGKLIVLISMAVARCIMGNDFFYFSN